MIGGLSGDPIQGAAIPALDGLREAFARGAVARPSASMAITVYHRGEPVADLWSGPAYVRDSLQLVFSVTKAMTAVATMALVGEGLLDLDAPVADVWPDFGRAGKDAITTRWILAHRAGLPTVDARLTMDDLVARDPVIRALEAQAPLWAPGTAHGYHLWTLGYLADEVVRRTTGVSVGAVFREKVAGPLGLDAWIGLPASEHQRVAPVRLDDASATGLPSEAVLTARADPGSVHSRTTGNPPIDPIAWNSSDVLGAAIPAGNGVADARSLARMLAACIGEVDGVRLFDEAMLEALTASQSEGFDLVGLEENRFGLGVFLPFPRLPFGGPGSFGHDGLGGCVALADADHELAFAYTTDLVPVVPGADPIAWHLLDAARDGIQHA